MASKSIVPASGINIDEGGYQLSVNGDMEVNGKLSIASQPAFGVSLSEDDTSGSGTTLRFNAIDFNIGNCYNQLTGEFTAPVAGIYHFDIGLLWRVESSTASTFRADLMLNGDSDEKCIQEGKVTANNGGGDNMKQTLTITTRLNAGDRIYVRKKSTGKLLGGHRRFSNFSGYLIG